jgi:HK97 family phage major capsid protein
MQINEEVMKVISEALREKYGHATQSQLDLMAADIVKRTGERGARGGPQFSLSRAIRGMAALHRSPINNRTVEEDVSYVKALTTGSTPGSYLIPTLQANEIIAALLAGGVARSAGVRIWDMQGTQKLTVPTALSSPAWVWTAQNSVQTPTDPNLGQMSFDLKERRALVAVPNQLIATSVPSFDTLLADLIGAGAAEHEDVAFFSTTTVSGAPTSVQATAGITFINVGGSANGGNIGYSDLLAVLAKASSLKMRGPFCWFLSGRSFYSRLLSMVDGQSRPLVIPTLTQGLQAPISFSLLGYPAYVTPFLTDDQTLGSGTNTGTILFTNPKYLHIAQDGMIELAISTEFLFSSAQTAVRAVNHEDFGVAPPQGLIALRGVL